MEIQINPSSSFSFSNEDGMEDNDMEVFNKENTNGENEKRTVQKFLPNTDHYRHIFLSSTTVASTASQHYYGEMNSDLIPMIYTPDV